MKVLIVEDSDYKSKRVRDFLNENGFDDVKICMSFSSGQREILLGTYELLILDMSMPTFDNQNGKSGGDHRHYGGIDLARVVKRKEIGSKFLFLTQHESFKGNPKIKNLYDVDLISKQEFSENYLGCIFYDHVGYAWKEKIRSVLRAIR